MDQPIGELRPNVRKIFLLNLFKVGGVALALVIAIQFLGSMINFDDLSGGLEAGFQGIGIKFSPPSQSTIIMWVTISLFGAAMFILLFNYLTLGKVRYVFYPDHMTLYKNFLMVQLKEQNIPYGNISKVSVAKKALGTGTISLELSGMDFKEVKIEFIDNAEQVSANIQHLIQDYKANYYAQCMEQYRLGRIADNLGQ